jgi:uncharacterized LabA/DUF88 family protein
VRNHAYIDGFALYHLCYRGVRNNENRFLKWLDLRRLCESIVPDDEVALVRYYTARVGDTPEDSGRATRQDVYLRALRTVPGLEICEGRFHRSKREARLAKPPQGVDPRQTVWIPQEKGSDVSMAVHLLMDAFDGRMDQAILMTNDSDFVEPIRIVRERFGIRIMVISPDDKVSKRLASVAHFARPLDQRLLAACQFPPVVYDTVGRAIHRPAAWTSDE